MPEKMGAVLTLVDASQLQVYSYYAINITAAEIIPIGSHEEPAVF
ncbi:unnamed protein product, partial [marine sediment metagenome]